jgi:hypothetical protein
MKDPVSEIEEINGEKVELYYFTNPMLHEDWHKAEELGLEYVMFIRNGPDYWDDTLCFCKIGYKDIVNAWLKRGMWF